MQAAFEAHKKLKLYDRQGESIYDKDLNILFNYYARSENEILIALKNVEERLDDSEDIPIYSYSKLVYSLIVCHTILEFDYTSCKEKMVANMQQHGKEIDPEILFFNHFKFENEYEKQQFTDFIKELREAVDVSNSTTPIFSYEPEDIHSFYNHLIENETQMTAGHTFISKFDLDKLVEMIFTCTPSQLDEWRGIMFSIYRHSIRADFLETDRSFMEDLVVRINEALPARKNNIDRILLMQINYLIDNLRLFISQLS